MTPAMFSLLRLHRPTPSVPSKMLSRTRRSPNLTPSPLIASSYGRSTWLSTTPYIDFSGAVWTTRPNVQTLSHVLPLCYHNSDTRMRATTARHFGALGKALLALKECYESVDLNTVSPTPGSNLKSPVDFPFRYSYTCTESSSTLYFRYINQMDPTKLIFVVETTVKKMICVKFVRRYPRDAHELCATEGFAPALYGFERLPGGWYMVVMDLIRDYCSLREFPVRDSYEDQITQVLEQLHQKGLIHGDIRDTNIMVKQDGGTGIQFKLVDFDWSGKMGEIRYPMNVYRGMRLWRPDGARDGELILAEHDIEMLHAIFHGPPTACRTE